jgi:signal transduction histidine kinase
MTDTPAILLVDSNTSDRRLAQCLLERELSQAAVTEAPDALALADALTAGAPDVAVVAADLSWADVNVLIGNIKRRSPHTAIVLLGRRSDITRLALDPGLACDAVVRKNSAGFAALGSTIEQILAGRKASAGADGTARPSGARGRDGTRDPAPPVSPDVKRPAPEAAAVSAAQSPRSLNGDPIGATALQHIIARAERTSGMLRELVDYVRVITPDVATAPIDLTMCLNRALEHLGSVIAASDAEIRTAVLPQSIGDERQITYLFQTLVSTAIKLRGRDRPLVTIGCEPQGDRWLVQIRSNGISIPDAFATRIFEPGGCVDTSEEYPWTGISLWLCRRIVERHGGRIAVESAEGGGVTFPVLLPRTPTGMTGSV